MSTFTRLLVVTSLLLVPRLPCAPRLPSTRPAIGKGRSRRWTLGLVETIGQIIRIR